MEKYANVCGVAFEDLSDDEMLEYDGGGSFGPLILATTLPCGVGASISIASVSIAFLIFG